MARHQAKLTKQILIREIHQRTGLTIPASSAAVEALIELLVKTFTEGGRLELQNVLTLQTVTRQRVGQPYITVRLTLGKKLRAQMRRRV